MNTTIQKFKVNDEVRTPNGKGVMQGVMVEDHWQYIVVRHMLKDMTSRPEHHCLTKRVLTSDSYPSGLWYYNPNEVTHA